MSIDPDEWADAVAYLARAVPIPDRSVEPTVNELADAAEVAWRNLLVAESQELQADGCCSADVWRGHLCPYHQGFEDGIDIVLDRLRAMGEMTSGL